LGVNRKSNCCISWTRISFLKEQEQLSSQRAVVLFDKGTSIRESNKLLKHSKWASRPRPGAMEAMAFLASV